MQIVKPLKHTPQLVISCCPELPACLPCPQTILASLRFRSGAAENLQKLDPAQYAILILWGEISCLFFLSGKKLFTSIIPWLLVFRFSQGINNAIKVTKLFFLFITCCNLKRKKSHLQQSGERQERAENRGLMAEADWCGGGGGLGMGLPVEWCWGHRWAGLCEVLGAADVSELWGVPTCSPSTSRNQDVRGLGSTSTPRVRPNYVAAWQGSGWKRGIQTHRTGLSVKDPARWGHIGSASTRTCRWCFGRGS